MKKERERQIVVRFLDTLYPGVAHTLDDQERPDFTAHINGRQIGIEHSALHWDACNGSPRQEAEALRKVVCNEAQQQWLEAQRPHIEVGMTFEPGARLRKAEVSALARQVVALVEGNLPAEGSSTRLQHGHENRSEWPAAVHSISISRLVPYGKTYWHAHDSDWIPELTIDYLQRRIDDKNASAAGYHPCDEQWLVLSMEAGRLSSTFDVPQATREADYSTVFSRVFLFEVESRSVIELKR
jgi:hypothetical protein